jgi:hypothetical protein
MMWIGFVATGGWLIIIPAIILGIFFGDEHPWRLVSIPDYVSLSLMSHFSKYCGLCF